MLNINTGPINKSLILQITFYLASFSTRVFLVRVKALKRKYAIASGQDGPTALTVG